MDRVDKLEAKLNFKNASSSEMAVVNDVAGSLSAEPTVTHTSVATSSDKPVNAKGIIMVTREIFFNIGFQLAFHNFHNFHFFKLL